MDSELEMTEPERRELEQAAKYGHCWLLRRRAQAILLLGQERTPAEVADILNTRLERSTSGGVTGGRLTWQAWPSDRIPDQQARVEMSAWTASAGRGELDLAYFNESGFSVNPLLRYARTRGGEQKAVFPQRHSQRFNVLGCLLHSELVWQGIWARVDAEAVICFMNELVKRLRRWTILVLDNAFVHTRKKLLTWQIKWRQRGLEFYFLPAYCSELNLIEGLWRQVKYHWYPFSEANALELEERIVRISRARVMRM